MPAVLPGVRTRKVSLHRKKVRTRNMARVIETPPESVIAKIVAYVDDDKCRIIQRSRQFTGSNQ